MENQEARNSTPTLFRASTNPSMGKEQDKSSLKAGDLYEGII